MTKIFYDNSKINMLNSELEETLAKVNNVSSIASSIRVPGGFGRPGDISRCVGALSSASSVIKETQTWLNNIERSFKDKEVEINSRLQQIDKIEIRRKDLLVK